MKGAAEMQFRSIGQIIVDIINALDWYRKIGIPTADTRLEKIHNYAQKVLNPITPGFQALGTGTTEEDAYYALSDGSGFGLIAAEMSKVASPLLPRGALRDILCGPLAVSSEGPSSSDSRNKFVELELAANLSSAGINLVGFDDLKFQFEGCRYIVECKRPSHDRTLDNNIEKAYRQLQARLEHSTDRGIVAIAVEKVLGLDCQIHDLDSPASSNEFAILKALELSPRVVKYRRMWTDPRIVGVFEIMRFLSRTKMPNSVGANYILVLEKFATPKVAQAAESRRLDDMIAALKSHYLGARRDT
ncbi:MAG: hypothetical protein ABSH05_28045 [Bryobacteraceae bacterium]|jgi:hypothetical protein